MITEFRGKYNFLSNFEILDKPMLYGGDYYPTNEHFYQAMKFTDKETRSYVSKHPSKGLKKFVGSIDCRDDWDSIKLQVMLYGLRYKFGNSNPTLKQKLVSTGQQHIQEGNYWNDKFWGVCLKTGEGNNNLGKLLMQVRGEIS